MPVFAPLAPKTDLNLTPSNWLRKTVGLRPETVLTGSRYATNQSSFSGLAMANNHIECVSKVDIISDAEVMSVNVCFHYTHRTCCTYVPLT